MSVRKAKCRCGRGPTKAAHLDKCEACLYEAAMREARLERVPQAANVVQLQTGRKTQ